MTIDLAAIRHTAEDIAREAGAVIMQRYGRPIQQITKSSVYDIVTDADKASEAVIVSALQNAFPDHHIVGEEGGGMGAPIETAAYRWYVDPIDGTTNFANHIPMFAISLALTDASARPLVGVVFNPIADEMYSAADNMGATLNNAAIHVSEADDLRQSVVGSGFPYSKYSNADHNAAEWSAFLTRTRGIRRMGSAALDLCYVAAGRFDGYWEQQLSPWDCMGGIVLVSEAGGTVTDYTGSDDPQRFLEGRVIASNGRIHAQMQAVIAETRGETV